MTSTFGLDIMSSVAMFLWIGLPILTWIGYRKYFCNATGCVIAFIGTVLLGYLLYVGAIWMVGKEYEYALSKFDLDGDGSFSDAEYTPEAQAAMKRLTNDTGRTFAPIVAAPISLIWASLWFSLLSAGAWIFNRFSLSRSQSE